MPWEEIMRFGLGVMRLSPAALWAATPREIAAAAGPGGTAPGRGELAALMRRFPDTPQ